MNTSLFGANDMTLAGFRAATSSSVANLLARSVNSGHNGTLGRQHSNILGGSAALLGPENWEQLSSGLETAEAKMIDYRGEKVAGFDIDGQIMICLPQAYSLFLKHSVGGLHTVYTKLKRLGIEPKVCNVEQVRALRSQGAIQPGVNRCKLISCRDFDTLFEDCNNASSRPGRPPKRSPGPYVSPSGMPLNMGGGVPMKKSRPQEHLQADKLGALACNGGGGLAGLPGGVGGLFNPSWIYSNPSQVWLASLSKMYAEMQENRQMPQPSGTEERNGAEDIPERKFSDSDHQSTSSPDGAINLTMGGGPGLSSSAIPQSSAGQSSLADSLIGQPNLMNGVGEDCYSDEGESQDQDDIQGNQPNPGPAFFPGPSRNRLPTVTEDEQAYFGSVESVLLCVRGLLDHAALFSRQQMEQMQADKWELSKKLSQERGQRLQAEEARRQAKRAEAVYRKQLRRNQRMLNKLKNGLRLSNKMVPQPEKRMVQNLSCEGPTPVSLATALNASAVAAS